MSLTEGTKLGAYEITGQIGAGGMGEVYRAIDTRLSREVAIKTLPTSLAEDSDRLARFEREAKLLASLNHAHIGAVHSLDEHEGTLYIAMELVEGETLEEKLKAGAASVGESLQIALQIASALEAAHDKGVVHRDLKPANIMLTADGQVKVLDFGLAKAFSQDPDEANAAQSPALSVAMTQAGLILGTAGYMSPEQASGQATDQRADVWAFGVVLFEMLSGLPLFTGESVPHILADVLKSEPDWSRLPKDLDPRIIDTLERCLEKKMRNRYYGISDARVDIERILQDPNGAAAYAATRGDAPAASSLPHIAATLVLTALMAGIVGWLLWPESVPRPVNRFDYELPEERGFRGNNRQMVTVSPDGRHIVYNSNEGLFLRTMGELEAQLIPGTVDALINPFFSPDSQSVGFFQDDELRRIAISGGASVVVASGLAGANDANWEKDGTILIAESDGISRVSANGGVAELVIERVNERVHAPMLLPGDDLVLFSTRLAGGDWDGAQIVVESLSTGERTVLVEGGSDAIYLPTGHLVYALEDGLFGIAFDVETLTTLGGPVPLVEGVMRAPSGTSAAANFAVAEDGTLVYISGETSTDAGPINIVVADAEGGLSVLGDSCACLEIAASPDGESVAITIATVGNLDVWIWSESQRTLRRLTLEPESYLAPVWTPDSQRIAYAQLWDDGGGIYWRAADGTGGPALLVDTEFADAPIPSSWSSDDELFFTTNFEGSDASEDADLGVLAVGGDHMPRLLLSETFNEQRPAISPDGRYLAYESDESGQFEIYVRPYPDLDAGKWQLSSGGGEEAEWAADGATLYFRNERNVMAVAVETESTFSWEPPAPVLDFSGYLTPGSFPRRYDVLPGLEAFIALTPSVAGLGTSGQREIVIVQNWMEELKRLVPTE